MKHSGRPRKIGLEIWEDMRDGDYNLKKEGTGQKLMGNNSEAGFGST